MWKRCSVWLFFFFFKLIAVTTEKVFVTVMQICLLIWPQLEILALSPPCLCVMRITCAVAFWTAIYVWWQLITAPPPLLPPQGLSGCSRTSQSRVQLVEFNNFFPPSCRNAQNLQSSEVILISEQEGQRGAELRNAPYGWMGFLRGMLSVAGLNPWAMTVISAAIESEKIPSVVAVVCLSPSICHWLKCWGISSSSPLTPPHPFITRFSLYISAIHHPSAHPPIHPHSQMVVSSLSPSITLHPPPLWSPQKRLIQEGWAGVSELMLLCPMWCFHRIFLLLCCFYGPDMLTVQVAESQTYRPHKGCLFAALEGCVLRWKLRCRSFLSR